MSLLKFPHVIKVISFLIFMRFGSAEVTIDALFPNMPPNFTEVAETLGLPCEEVEVVTEDGYILDVFHIPGDPKRPVLIQSGDLGSADDYLLLGKTSLTYVLHEAGYDVWVGNVRGCRYGRRHVHLDPDTDDAFWDFSFHEHGVYDTPAMVDFVLNRTRAPSLSSIGWSYGTATNYIMGAERPEYNKKVNVLISFAPIAYINHCKSCTLGATFSPLLNVTESLLDRNEVCGEESPEVVSLRKFCSTVETAYEICLNGTLSILGFDKEQIEPEMAVKLYQYHPSSTSRKNLLHQSTNIVKKRFAKFDYGPEENMKRYGSIVPPEYDMSKNEMNMVLISGKNDLVSTLKDVEILKSKIVNLDEHIILDPEKFNHLDYACGKDTHKVLFEPIVLEKLKKFYKGLLQPKIN